MNAADSDHASSLRRAFFGVVAAFVLLAPALPQVFGVHAALFRPWVMYSGVGLGLLQGEFAVTRDGEVEMLSPESFLNINHYVRSMSLSAPHVVLDEAALIDRITAYCEANRNVTTVSFDGKVSGIRGWRPMRVTAECAQ